MAGLSTKKIKAKGGQAFGWLFWVLIVLYSFNYDRWQTWIPPLRYFKIPGLLTLFLTLWWLVKADKKFFRDEALLKIYLLFACYIAISFFWGVNNHSIFRIMAFFLLFTSLVLPTVSLVDTPEKIRVFFRAWVSIQAIVAIWAIGHAGQGPGDFLLDENDLGSAMCMAFPYGLFLISSKREPVKWRIFYFITTALIVWAIVSCRSRGALVGLVGVFGAVCWFSKKRIRNLIIGLVIAVLVVLIAPHFLPHKYIARMDTMADPNNGTRVERLRSWEIARIMWADNPFFGVGIEQFKWNVGRYEKLTSYWVSDKLTKSLQGREAHSVYFSLLADLGLVGVAIYAGLLITLFRVLNRVAVAGRALDLAEARRGGRGKSVADDPQSFVAEGAVYARAILSSILAFLVTGTFISILYYPNLWLIVGFTVVIKRATSAGMPVDRKSIGRSGFGK